MLSTQLDKTKMCISVLCVCVSVFVRGWGGREAKCMSLAKGGHAINLLNTDNGKKSEKKS